MHHTCGSVFPLVQDLIDVGVDILNPIQTSARDMDPVALKRDFGDRLVFHRGWTRSRFSPLPHRRGSRRR